MRILAMSRKRGRSFEGDSPSPVSKRLEGVCSESEESGEEAEVRFLAPEEAGPVSKRLEGDDCESGGASSVEEDGFLIDEAVPIHDESRNLQPPRLVEVSEEGNDTVYTFY